MKYQILFSKHAKKDLKKIDEQNQSRILDKLSFFEIQEDPLYFSVPLKGFSVPTFRFRVGVYRIIFRKDVKTKSFIVLVVLAVGHRSDVYRE